MYPHIMIWVGVVSKQSFTAKKNLSQADVSTLEGKQKITSLFKTVLWSALRLSKSAVGVVQVE